MLVRLQKLNLESIEEFSQIEDIYNKDYKYSYYEIKKLSELVKINTIILSSQDTGILPNGIRCYNTGSDKYLLLNIVNDKYDKFNLILKNTTKFIFKDEDFKKTFKETIKKYCEKTIIKKD